ncbi:hypothetical protein GCM10023257_11630 [Streptomyces hyderabadensis]|uniref:Uncharacterized protein n=1 Tax=Streptomyces hyderabadensis TaxID=598549 RepID=A0ABP9HQJ6_9ACTN
MGQEGGAAALAGAAEQGAVEGAGGVGGLGGVLGHGLVGELDVNAEGCDLAYIELLAPSEFAFPNRIRLDRDADPCSGGAYGVGEHGGGGWLVPSGPSRRMTAWKWTRPRCWYSATLAKEIRRTA